MLDGSKIRVVGPPDLRPNLGQLRALRRGAGDRLPAGERSRLEGRSRQQPDPEKMKHRGT